MDGAGGGAATGIQSDSSTGVAPPRCCCIYYFFEQMERCQQQVGLGLPPCPDLEEEWRRMLRDERRRQRDREERDRVSRRTNKQTNKSRLMKNEETETAGDRFRGTKRAAAVPEKHAPTQTGEGIEFRRPEQGRRSRTRTGISCPPVCLLLRSIPGCVQLEAGRRTRK